MFARALKTNIVISITVLLFMGMLLINIVSVKTLQRDLIKARISQTHLIESIIKNRLVAEFDPASLGLDMDVQSLLSIILASKDAAGIIVKGSQNRVYYAAGKRVSKTPELEKMMNASMSSGERIMRFAGKTWGVFWKQNRYLLAAVPLTLEEKKLAVGIVVDLGDIYHQQRASQRFIMLYLVANTLIFALIGFYRLSRLYLEPINRLVSMAEDYQEEDGTFFPVRKEDNELSTLSKALNLMLNRISEDKKKLQLSVTSLEKTNLKLKRAQEEIVRAEKLASVGRLSSGIAHEIGNPIGIVMGYLELLKQKNVTESEKSEYITRTENEINRINTVIHQLLDLSRPSAKGTEHISVHDIILEITDVLKLQPLMASIQLDLALEADRDLVMADAGQLRQVFLNLAINAADAVSSIEESEKGRLTISTGVADSPENENDLEGAALVITFKDNGPGIPADLVGNIFDPFFTTKEPGKGTGLGLSVSFMIIESFGGTIRAESAAGGGAVMTILLPLTE
jgi:two-component system NtrC family sensor kinase